MMYALGVDGGGSKTLAVIVDAQGHERGRGIAGSSNHTGVGIESAVQAIYSAIEQAARMADCSLPVRAAWFGLAGIDRPADHSLLLPHLQPCAQSVCLTNDAELVLSGLPGAVGIALIAGTGSIALGRDEHGAFARSGGWGHIIGDEGSGYELGRQCLQAVARAADGRGAQTALTDLLLKHWHLENAGDMIGKVYQESDKAAIARLSSLVFAAASNGDDLACHIIDDAAHELALATLAVKNSLNFSDERIDLALGGGLLLHEPAFRTRLLHAIRQHLSLGNVALVAEPALSGARAALKQHPCYP